MLFDLEDYRTSGFFGRYVSNQYPKLDPIPLEKINPHAWDDCETTARVSAGSLHKDVTEYIDVSLRLSTLSERTAILDAEVDIWTKYVAFRKISVDFWNGLKSIPLKGQFNEGDTFNVMTAQDAINTEQVGFNFEVLLSVNQNPQLMVAVLYENGDGYFKYKELTQELYDSYVAALKAWLKSIKDLYVLTDNSTFEDWVAPLVPAWNEYPELSGYVRDIEGRIVEGATVNLIDAQGDSYSMVTNASGYYKFSKEYIYNNIELTNLEDGQLNTFKITVSNVTESGTALYSTTNKFQSSFYGAVNDRGVEWEVSLKNGKENRKNFRVDFLEDYTSYPSIKGQVLDQDGNPVQNAFVELDYLGMPWNTPAIGSVKLPDGSWKKRSKYTLFGEQKSILTDATGHYEYPSQLVGEWFNSFVSPFNPKPVLNYNPYQDIIGVTLDEQLSGLSSGFTFNGSKLPVWSYLKAVKQSDGKIVVSGIFTEYNGTPVGSVVRLNSDGSLDETFTMTYVSNNYTFPSEGYINNQSYITSLDLDADDKLIISGQFDTVNGVSRTMIARLNADGTVDETFDAGNIFSGLMTNANGDLFGSPQNNVIKIQPDGKILVGGWFLVPSVKMSCLVRLNSDGTIDNTFINGLDLPQGIYGGALEDPRSIEIQPDGKILVGGSQWNGWFLGSYDWNSVDWNDPSTMPSRAIFRLNADGTLDNTFDVGSLMYKTDNEPGVYSRIHCIKVDEAGKILIGGEISKFGNINVNNIVKLNSDGTLDMTLPINNIGTRQAGSVVFSIFANSEKIIAFGGFDSVYDDGNGSGDSGGIMAFDLDGSQVQNYELQKSLKFVNDNGVSNISVNSFVDLGDSLMVFGSFDRFDDGGNYPGIQSKTIAKIKIGPMSFYAPHLTGQYSSNLGWDISLNNPPLRGDGLDYALTQNDFKVTLNPYIQDPSSGDIIETGDSSSLIYNNQDWFNSRFSFASNERNEVYIKTIIPGENVINVREYLVDPEHNAEKVYFNKPMDINQNMSIGVKSTTGYVTAKFWNGDSQIFGYGDPTAEFTAYKTAYDGDSLTDRTSYLYSSSVNGVSSGHLTKVLSGEMSMEVDFTNAPSLESILYYGVGLERLDLTGSTNLRELQLDYCKSLKEIVGLSDLTNLKTITINAGVLGTNYTRSTTEFEYVMDDDTFVGDQYSTFGFNGRIDYVKKLSNGKYVVIGDMNNYRIPTDSSATGSFNQISITRNIAILNSDFSLDRTFVNKHGSNNSHNSGFTNNYDSVNMSKVIELENGKFLVAGSFSGFTDKLGTFTSQSIIRFNQDGSLDRTFVSQLEPGNSKISNIEIYNGKIMVYGSIYKNGGWVGLSSLNLNGSIDSQFTIPVYCDYGQLIYSDRQSDGKLILASTNLTSYKGTEVRSVIKVNQDGSLDINFNNNVKSIIAAIHGLKAVKVQNDRKILISFDACYFNDSTMSQSSIIRLNDDGTLDTAFNSNIKPFNSNPNINFFEIKSDGSIFVGGNIWQYDGVYHGGLIILNSDGTLNNSFNSTNNAIMNEVKGIISEGNSIICYGWIESVFKNGQYGSESWTYSNHMVKFRYEGKINYSFNLPNSLENLSVSYCPNFNLEDYSNMINLKTLRLENNKVAYNLNLNGTNLEHLYLSSDDDKMITVSANSLPNLKTFFTNWVWLDISNLNLLQSNLLEYFDIRYGQLWSDVNLSGTSIPLVNFEYVQLVNSNMINLSNCTNLSSLGFVVYASPSCTLNIQGCSALTSNYKTISGDMVVLE